ncbi:MAG TPA: hypothetical protein VFP32_01375 [Candidatus Saccharimonadales bacterium]|nr:hypothetical protein [Candidatus Saccharimonadales bacterium]
MDPQQTSGPVSYNSVARGGSSAKYIVTIVILVLLLVAVAVFGYWAFSGRQDYKNNAQQKIDKAVSIAKQQQAADLQKQFDQQSKSPYKVFKGSPTYGTVTFNYPKTWSAYVDSTSSSEPINAYFNPDQVPGLNSRSAFALRVELESTDYSQVVQQFNSYISQGKVAAQAYLPPKLKNVTNAVPGTLFSGHVNLGDSTQNGELLVIKVRDKTLEVYTESNDYLNDFNNAVLSSLSFVP